MKGVDAIEHTASPAQFHMTDPREYIEPAVSGTVGILKSALAHANDTVKRVVITSSIAAVVSTEDVPVGTVVSEANWNEHSVRDVEQKGGAAGPGAMYRASKTLAEKAAWAFLDEHKGEAGFDLVVLNPSYIFGPVLQHVDRPEDLNVSAKEWWSAVVGGAKTLEQLTTTPGYVALCILSLEVLMGGLLGGLGLTYAISVLRICSPYRKRKRVASASSSPRRTIGGRTGVCIHVFAVVMECC